MNNKAIMTPERVPLIVIEAKSLQELRDAENQVIAQGIAMCNVA